jgi:lysophospholipase L1-like esterase
MAAVLLAFPLVAVGLPGSATPGAEAATPITVTFALSSSTLVAHASGRVPLAGTVTCSEAAEVYLSVGLDQAAPVAVSGSGYVEPMACGPAATPWSTVVSGSPSGFANGPATVQLSAFALSTTSSGFADQSDPVTITGVSTPAHPLYYLALGDSLATGYAAGSGEGYVDLLEDHYQAIMPNLVEVDFGCSSETTDTMLHGGICSFGGLSQEDAAVAFLKAHPRQVALVTIDIGGNDVVFCTTAQCFTDAFATMHANLTTILTRLRDAAGPDVPFYGMTYFDPLLGNWLSGPGGQGLAQGSVVLLDQLNAQLVDDYAAVGAPSADVAGAFASDDFTLVSSPWGMIPRNVRNACTWLDITCTVGQSEGFGDDANAEGYQVIAAAFEAVIAPLVDPSPTTTTSTTSPPSSVTTSSTPTSSGGTGAPAPSPATPVSAAPALTG